MFAPTLLARNIKRSRTILKALPWSFVAAYFLFLESKIAHAAEIALLADEDLVSTAIEN